MTITYPLTPPATPGFNRAEFSITNFVSRSSSVFTGKTQVQTHQGQVWGVQFGLPPMKRAAAEEWNAFFASLNGSFGTFLVGDPLGGNPRGTTPGAPAVAGASQTGQELNTDGWTATQTGILLAGDYIQLTDGSTERLHKVLVDVDSDGGGLATIDIWPRLRESPTDSSSIVVNDTVGTFRLLDNTTRWFEQLGDFYSLAFSAVEAI